MTTSHEVEEFVKQEIRPALRQHVWPLLKGKPPELQGAALADLLATFIAGHAPELREQILDIHIAIVRDLIPFNEKEMFGERGHPGRIHGGDR